MDNGRSDTADRSRAEAEIAGRFAGVSPEAPLAAALRDLALRREILRPAARHRGERESPAAAGPETLAELRKDFSLLPLDTVEHKVRLPSLPAVVIQLQQAIDRGAAAGEIAALLGLDPKLAAAVLSLVNSPLYGLSSRIESLSRAVAYLGDREISALGLGLRLLTMFEDAAPSRFPLREFWEHSIATASLAYEISLMRDGKDPEKCFAAGLLHDLGRVILATAHPDLARAAWTVHRDRGMDLRQAELLAFDVDHCMLGSLFFGKWKLPRSVVNSALYHHSAEYCLGKEVEASVYAANFLANCLGIGCNIRCSLNPRDPVWQSLAFTPEELAALVGGLESRLDLLFETLFPH